MTQIHANTNTIDPTTWSEEKWRDKLLDAFACGSTIMDHQTCLPLAKKVLSQLVKEKKCKRVKAKGFAYYEPFEMQEIRIHVLSDEEAEASEKQNLKPRLAGNLRRGFVKCIRWAVQ